MTIFQSLLYHSAKAFWRVDSHRNLLHTKMAICITRSTRNFFCIDKPLVLYSNPNIFVRNFAITGRHSKNVAGKKNKLDALKTKFYNRLGIKIIMAIKAGGPNADTNIELARALKDAQAGKLPKDNIDRAFKKASNAQTEDFKSVVYEVFGFGGAGILVTALTDNTNRSYKAIKAVVNKTEGAKMASSGSVMFSFNHKGVLRIKSPQNTNGMSEGSYKDDDFIEAALDIGADSIDFLSLPEESNEPQNESVTVTKAIVVDPEFLAQMQDVLAEKYKLDSSTSLEYLPNSKVTLSDEDIESNEKLIDAFEDLDDVDVVYHNIE